MPSSFRITVAFSVSASVLATPGAPAQRARAAATSTSAADSARTRSAFPSLRWRNIGPFRGGRSVAVTGSYTDPRVFYFGAVNGGVWKTTNGGQSWSNISDFRVTGGAPEISSVGALTVAPSDPNVIWVGQGGLAQHQPGNGAGRTAQHAAPGAGRIAPAPGPSCPRHGENL